MAWRAWLLIGWTVVATACALGSALALANADVQDGARRITEDADVDRTPGLRTS